MRVWIKEWCGENNKSNDERAPSVDHYPCFPLFDAAWSNGGIEVLSCSVTVSSKREGVVKRSGCSHEPSLLYSFSWNLCNGDLRYIYVQREHSAFRVIEDIATGYICCSSLRSHYFPIMFLFQRIS